MAAADRLAAQRLIDQALSLFLVLPLDRGKSRRVLNNERGN